MHDTTIRRILGFFLAIAVVLIGVAFESVRNINRSVATSDWVNHTHAVILEAETIRSGLEVAEGAVHTYVLTGDARDLDACREAVASIEVHLELGKALTRFESSAHEQIIGVESLVTKRAAFFAEVLAARKASKMDAVRALLEADAGRTAVREIQRKLQGLKDEEMALLAERDTASYRQAQTTRWTVWSGVVLDVLLLIGVAWVVRDDIAARQRAATLLLQANEQLEVQVQKRTAELVQANSRFAADNLESQWANHALEHQLRYNQLIVNSVSDLVFVLTKALNISRVNPAVTHLTGLEPADLVNQPLSRVVRLVTDANAETRMFDPVMQALRDGRDLRDQPAELEDKRGRKTAVLLALFPLRDRDKVVGGVVTVRILRAPAEAKE